MEIRISVFTAMILMLCFAGCTARYTGGNDAVAQVDVFGVQLYSGKDYREINGVRAEEEPCLRGYVRTFDSLDIVVGYGFDGKVRKITTRNAGTAMFGVRPGMPLAEGKTRVLREGFRETASPFTFDLDRYSLTFLIKEKDTIFGLTLQAAE